MPGPGGREGKSPLALSSAETALFCGMGVVAEEGLEPPTRGL